MSATDRAPNGASTNSTTVHPSEPSEFEIRRSELVADIGDSLETVLQHLNSLNRSLEGIIAIGNDFSSVEALWSQFETVMGREGDDGTREEPAGVEAQDGDGEGRHDGSEGKADGRRSTGGGGSEEGP